MQAEFKPLAGWWKDVLSTDLPACESAPVSDVKVSKRLSATPCVVVASKVGLLLLLLL